MGVEILSSYRKEGPAVLARAPRCAQSLAGFPQRIFIGFIKTLDCAAVEALIPNLQPRAERFGRAQVLNCDRRASAADANRRYFVRLPLMGFARNSSAGAL
jgi:hypothetical protein